jgi:hypothetical protein
MPMEAVVDGRKPGLVGRFLDVLLFFGKESFKQVFAPL